MNKIGFNWQNFSIKRHTSIQNTYTHIQIHIQIQQKNHQSVQGFH